MLDKQINVHVDEETHRAYKSWCAKHGVTMVGVIRVFIADILSDRGVREPPDYNDPEYYRGRTRLFKGDPPEETQ